MFLVDPQKFIKYIHIKSNLGIKIKIVLIYIIKELKYYYY